MLKGSYNSAVDEDFLEIGILLQMGKETMPDTQPRSTGKTVIVAVPEAELAGQITPWAAGASYPKRRLDKHAIVCGSTPGIASLFSKHCFDPLELIVPQPKTHHLDIRQKARI